MQLWKPKALDNESKQLKNIFFMKRLNLCNLIILLLIPIFLYAQDISRVEPPNWWVGMQTDSLQILIYGKNIGKTKPKLSNHEGIHLESFETAESPNYLFLNLRIEKTAKSGKLQFSFQKNNKEVVNINYPLLERAANSANRQGFSSKDAMYLLMPDRFANGNPDNDSQPNMLEKANRKALHGRHGGDIAGIIQHLDYLQDLGITALWTTPLLEDNLPEVSYHHYAISDYYKIDSRFGTNATYKQLSQKAKAHGIKLIMDVVTNHCSTAHWWLQDLPFENWVHQFPEFTRSNYRMSTLNDPHASQIDKKYNSEGWFDYTMPDLNQKNPKLLNYFTQLFIWWIEYADLGGLRIDTFPYNDIYAMAKFNQRIMAEYPNFNIVGECWQHSPQEISYWQKDVHNKDGYNSQLPTVMDFPLVDATALAFNESEGWDKGMSRFYEVFCLDYVYADLNNILVFLDNHDTERFAALVKENPAKMKLALTLICTVRGIPQIYYGTEIMMSGNKSVGDGDLRRDFPGGWQTDSLNAFTQQGRDSIQNTVFEHLRSLLQYRKTATALQTGKMMHFIPKEDVYVYFRYNETQTIMICLNNNDKAKTINSEDFKECMQDFTSATNILTGQTLSNLSQINIPAKGSIVLELQK